MKSFFLIFALSSGVYAADTCRQCHSLLDDKRLQGPAAAFEKWDIHGQRGFSCVDCHGGDSKQDDPTAAMDPKRGFLGKVARTAIPKLCARCHSDAALIHKFRPQQRVDQLAQYATSRHGKRLAEGDTAVATCVDCHSVHDIREVKNAASPVHPMKLPETCAKCHADAKHMAKYKISTSQFADYKTSVHWQALSKGGDLSAPTCASCHGNHGATPPQVGSVTAICGSCHALFENLFSKSPHQAAFASAGIGGCVVCHGNHAVQKPSSAMLSGASSVCIQCHEGGSTGAKAAEETAGLIRKLDEALNRSDGILRNARESGMEVSEAQLRQMDGHENLVKARVAVHAFNVAAVRKPIDEGLAIANETRQSGEQALREKDRRRMGLGISLITIVVTLAGLWLAIRTIESKSESGSVN
jgi:nitrate/TMAO reductase-like tetraheme cytochrome c subunit